MHCERVYLKLDLEQRWKPGGDSKKISRTWVAILECTGRDGQRARLAGGDDIHGRWWRCMVRKYRPLLSVDYGGGDAPTNNGACGENDRVDGDGSWHEGHSGHVTRNYYGLHEHKHEFEQWYPDQKSESKPIIGEEEKERRGNWVYSCSESSV